jgi:signal transduction histidine kinase
VAAASPLRQSELEVVREIAEAFLTATPPLEVYRLALGRVLPLVRASFGSVFLRDDEDPTLLRLVCAQNWPQTSARFLSMLRIREGRGPTGRAVAERVAIEVTDIFADPALREWWDPARELGFTSLIALPLEAKGQAVGALSFYFAERHEFTPEERELLRLIADQLAATAERAHLIHDLQGANERLRRQVRDLELRLRRAEDGTRRDREFLANLAQELRTPLTSILSYAAALGRGPGTGADRDRAATAAKAERVTAGLLALVTDLHDLSQLHLGRSRPIPGEAEAGKLARQAIARAGEVPAGITLRYEPPAEPIPLRVDAGKVLRILDNLLSNALKFTSAGEVRVRVRRVAGASRPWDREATRAAGAEESAPAGTEQVEWLVEDTGIGIPPAELSAIFDEYRQVDGSSTRLYGGTGLGLPLSLGLARLLGGDVTVESEPGRGSVFTLRLPAHAPSD